MTPAFPDGGAAERALKVLAWAISWFAGRLAVESRRLDLLRAGDLEVRASFRLGYDSLNDSGQLAFRMIGLLPADFPVWALAAVLGTGADEAEGLLEQLADAALADVAGVDAGGLIRYRAHDLLRDFAAERLRGDGPRCTAGRPTGGRGSARASWPSMRRRVPTRMRRPGSCGARACCTASWGCDEACDLLAQAALIFAVSGDQHYRAACLRNLGDAYRELAQWEESGRAFGVCIALYRDLGSDLEEARAKIRYAGVFRDQYLSGKALPLLMEGLEVVRRFGDQRDAAADLGAALAIFEDIGDRRWSARTRMSIAGLCRQGLGGGSGGVLGGDVDRAGVALGGGGRGSGEGPGEAEGDAGAELAGLAECRGGVPAAVTVRLPALPVVNEALAALLMAVVAVRGMYFGDSPILGGVDCPAAFRSEIGRLATSLTTGMANVSNGWTCWLLGSCDYYLVIVDTSRQIKNYDTAIRASVSGDDNPGDIPENDGASAGGA